MAWRVDTVFAWVSDLSRSIDWYEKFGIESGPTYGPWQTMHLDGTTAFALHHGERPDGPPTAVVAFGVDDLDAEMSRLEGLGIHPVDDEVTDAGVARFITYADPDGNQVQILQR